MKKPKLISQIETLKGWREIAFISALAQRSWPNFVLFYESCDLPGLSSLEAVEAELDYIWQMFQDKKANEVDEDPEVSDKLDKIAQDIELLAEQEEFGAEAAAGFLALLEQTLLCRLNQDKRRALQAREQTIELVSRMIQLQEYGSLEEEDVDEDELVRLLDKHPLMQRELVFHQALVHWLRCNSSPGPKAIDELRDIAREDDLSNMGISINDELA